MKLILTIYLPVCSLFTHLFKYPISGIRCLSYLILLVSVEWSGYIQAKEIYLLPSMSIHTEYDNNKRLRTDDNNRSGKSAYGVIARANAKLGIRADRYDVALDNQFILNRFKSDFDLDSEDFNIQLNSNYKVTEKNSFALTGNYRQDTTLTSELDENGTGVLEGNLAREQWAISPSWTYLLSNTQFFQASFSHNQVSYEESDTNQFVDFTTDLLSLSFSQQWTDSLRNFISVSAMSFLVPEPREGVPRLITGNPGIKSITITDLRRETTEYSVNIGLEYQISPTWSTSLTIGRRFTNTERTNSQFFTNNVNQRLPAKESTITDDAQGMIFSFNLEKQLETGLASASYSRSTSSQGDGQQRLVDYFNVNYRHRTSEHLQFALNGGVVFTTSSGNQDNVDDRTYYNIKPSVSWLFDRHASISIGYQYRMQEFENRSDSAESHSVFLNFNYQWDKLYTQNY